MVGIYFFIPTLKPIGADGSWVDARSWFVALRVSTWVVRRVVACTDVVKGASCIVTLQGRKDFTNTSVHVPLVRPTLGEAPNHGGVINVEVERCAHEVARESPERVVNGHGHAFIDVA